MKKFLSFICVAIFTSLIFCSCKSKEEKVIDRLKSLTEKIEKNSSNWDSEQWGEAFSEMNKIYSEIPDCKFSDEQLEELGEVEGELTTVMIKNGAEAFGKSVGEFFKGAGSFLKGFKEGLMESNQESLEEISNFVNSTLDQFKDIDSDN